MISHHGTWTLGVLLGLPVFALIILISLAGAGYGVWLLLQRRKDNYSTAATGIFCIAGGMLAALVFSAVAGIAYWPWHAEYHQYRAVTGTVQQVSNRLISAGDKGGSNQKFVVVFRDNPSTPFGIEDTRAALIKVGDRVSLRCKRVYQYGSDNAGYDCRWGRQG